MSVGLNGSGKQVMEGEGDTGEYKHFRRMGWSEDLVHGLSRSLGDQGSGWEHFRGKSYEGGT